MEYLSCSIADPLPSEDEFDVFSPQFQVPNKAAAAPPLAASSSCSSSLEDPSHTKARARAARAAISSLQAGTTSPSAVVTQRRLSTAISTSETSRHPALEGRPTLVLSPTPISSQISNNSSSDNTMRFRSKSTTASSHATTPKSVAPLITTCEEKGASNMCLLPFGCNSNDDDDPASSKRTGLHDAFRSIPSPLRLEAWALQDHQPMSESFAVRGPNYHHDRRKQPSQQPAFELMAVDMVSCGPGRSANYQGICSHPNERFQRALQREQETGVSDLPPFVVAINLVIPGHEMYHLVSYFAVSQDMLEEIKGEATPFGRLMNEFLFTGDDAFRNESFKLIPRIVEGNFVVRKAVGSKPALLGKKIKQYYIRTERYFELVVDISSEPVAQRIVKLALGYAKTLVVDMMFLVEGKTTDTLPERIFGGLRIRNMDFQQKDGKRLLGQPS